jgi:tetratricopeptide (TPR) repeat protein
MSKIVVFVIICLTASSVFAQVENAETIYEKYNDAIVRIFTYHEDGTMHGQGSGVIIKNNGWIITNYHVLGDATSIFAEHNGKLISLDSIIAIDMNKDVMLLQLANDIESKEYKAIPDIKLGDSDKLKVGQRVYAIGSPMGFENTISEGIISGLRTSPDSSRGLIQISAPISSGSSGGAVLNAKGELIGISTMVITGETAQNLNFALLINDVITASKNQYISGKHSGEHTAQYYYQKGYKEYMLKNYLSAILNYEKAIPASNEDEKGLIYYNIALAYERLGRYDDAINNYTKSLERSKTPENFSGLGSAYLQKKEYSQAIGFYELAIKLDPLFAEGFYGLALVHYEQKDYVKSLSNLIEVIKLNPKSYRAFYLAGEITSKTKMYDKAIYYYEQAIKYKPNYAEAYISMADLYITKGETEKAIEYQQKGYQLNPDLRNKKNEE